MLAAAVLIRSSVKRYDAMIASIFCTAAMMTSLGRLCTWIDVISA